ncbi:ribonuclease D [Propylenella binzhouense]|uniref:Ribonuclease D n=1 Tax=Propylenella binzhouense TaxID=2555902 RepID=A0A964WTZ2_9HYPH|nr:ribonuclease D [Propylenella binzhouense]MYZ48498.1 ribonuclease D [Propylenella binzhouense]
MPSSSPEYQLVTDPGALAALCERLARMPYVTVDTEFMRESTFWAQLCLVQIASTDEVAVVDPLAPGMDLGPFHALLANPGVVKVFHAARQDIEIFVKQTGTVPHPLFDTQIAAAVCGFGDQVSYEQLVYRITGHQIDKSSRFSDWAQRPLSGRQLSYAADDVVHLRQVYLALKASLQEQDRSHWVAEEMAVLTDVATYVTHPEEAWQRLKLRVKKPRQLAVLQRVSAWREREAQQRNVPRSRVLKDDAIYEIALQQPRNPESLGRLRSIPRGFERSAAAAGILKAVEEAFAIPEDALPRIPRSRPAPEHASAAADLLKVLLKMVAERNGVAARIIAGADDLEQIAASEHADVPALRGWRRELFGEQALALKRGEIALALSPKGMTIVAAEGRPQKAAE